MFSWRLASNRSSPSRGSLGNSGPSSAISSVGSDRLRRWRIKGFRECFEFSTCKKTILPLLGEKDDRARTRVDSEKIEENLEGHSFPLHVK